MNLSALDSSTCETRPGLGPPLNDLFAPVNDTKILSFDPDISEDVQQPQEPLDVSSLDESMAAQEAPSIFNDQPLFDCIQNLAKPANSGILNIAFPKDLVHALQQPPNCAISEKW